MIFAMVMASALASLSWIGDGRPAPTDEAGWYEPRPATYFRADFVLPENAAGTKLRIACLGYYNLFLENRQLNEGPMPLWSPFGKTIYADEYELYDAKPYPEVNHLYVALGNGFYNLPPLRFWGSKCFRDSLVHGQSAFKLEIDGVDKLDWTWRESKIVANSPYLGVEIDCLRPLDKEWRKAVEVEGAPGRIVPRTAPPVVVYDRLKGEAKWLKEGEVQIIDFGVNASGMPSYSFDAREGDRVEFIYGERLNEDGSVNPLTQTAGQIKHGNGGPGAPFVAVQRDVITAGGPVDVDIAFTWHICRYVEIRGLSTLVSRAEMRLISSELKGTARGNGFRSADERLNLLHEVCRRTFRSNLIGVQSDCPGRERLGYGGDIVATCEAMMLNWDMREFYLKTLQDFADEAEDDGWITETAPYVGIADKGYGGRSGPVAWAVAVPVLMDALMRNYPDVTERALKFYPVCARYIRLMDAKFPDGIVPICIGDHEALERADDGVNATAHWHEFVRLTAKFAARLGRDDEAKEFAAIAGKIRSAFIGRYVRDGIVDNGTQSAQAIGLYLGLVPDDQISAAEARLIAAVKEKDFAPFTGIYSTRYMLMYLSEHGQADLARRIVLHEGFPGWLHMLDRGATTLWETWAESDDVYSNCHPMFGSVDEWLLRFEH